MSADLFDNEWSLMVAGLGVDALIQAGLIKKEDYDLATEILGEETFVRLVGGDRPSPAPAWIFLDGWNQGFNKVRCTELIRDHSNFDLQEAKRTTDNILEGRR